MKGRGGVSSPPDSRTQQPAHYAFPAAPCWVPSPSRLHPHPAQPPPGWPACQLSQLLPGGLAPHKQHLALGLRELLPFTLLLSNTIHPALFQRCQHLAIANLVFIFIISSFQKSYTKEMKYYVIVGTGFFPLNIRLLRFIHVVTCISS